MTKLKTSSDILYIRAGLAPLASQIRLEGNLISFLHKYLDFEELFAPHFYGARLFWDKKTLEKRTNSGALGKLVRKVPGSTLSEHPSHPFVGYGDRVTSVLKEHNYEKDCFAPIAELADKSDFSMFLIGCLESSPGFSTVHAAQELLGLTKKHLSRFLLRWDYEYEGELRTKVAPESPGCSKSFGKFYDFYKETNNYVDGDWNGVNWIFIPSARKALQIEKHILENNPRFIKCDDYFCPTCSFRMY